MFLSRRKKQKKAESEKPPEPSGIMVPIYVEVDWGGLTAYIVEELVPKETLNKNETIWVEEIGYVKGGEKDGDNDQGTGTEGDTEEAE